MLSVKTGLFHELYLWKSEIEKRGEIFIITAHSWQGESARVRGRRRQADSTSRNRLAVNRTDFSAGLSLAADLIQDALQLGVGNDCDRGFQLSRRFLEPAASIERKAEAPERVRIGRFLIQGFAERLFGPALVYPFLSLAIRRGKIFSPLLISLIRACDLIK
jgi:hypothetical protein